jgi:hypothetical protein
MVDRFHSPPNPPLKQICILTCVITCLRGGGVKRGVCTPLRHPGIDIAEEETLVLIYNEESLHGNDET